MSILIEVLLLSTSLLSVVGVHFLEKYLDRRNTKMDAELKAIQQEYKDLLKEHGERLMDLDQQGLLDYRDLDECLENNKIIKT